MRPGHRGRGGMAKGTRGVTLYGLMRPGRAAAHSASTPETWAKFTKGNLIRAERERLASDNLRTLIDCILRDTAEDLRLQCDAVNLAFARRCEELEDARHKLQYHLQKVWEGATPNHPGHAHSAGHAHHGARPPYRVRPPRGTPTRQGTPTTGHAHPAGHAHHGARPLPDLPTHTRDTPTPHSSHAHPLTTEKGPDPCSRPWPLYAQS
jgi:hypothetical protein